MEEEKIKNKILELLRSGNTIKGSLEILQEEGVFETTMKARSFLNKLILDSEYYYKIREAKNVGRSNNRRKKIEEGSKIIQIIIDGKSKGETYNEIAAKYPEIFSNEVAVNRAYRKYIKTYPELGEEFRKRKEEYGRNVRRKIDIIVEGKLRKKTLAIIFSENPNNWSNVEELEEFYLENRNQIENLVKCTRFQEESEER